MKKNNIKFLIPLLFIMGVIYVMPNILNKYRKGEAKGKVIYYTINNAPMAAAYVVRSGNRGRRNGAVSHYAEAINLQTGEVVWSTKLSGQKDDRPSTHLLMAQSKVYLFYFLDGLIVVDKATGKIVAETKDLEKENPAQKENFPSRLDKYYFNEPEQALFFTGNDALGYALNLNTLKTTVTSNNKIPQRIPLYDNVYLDNTICGYDTASGKFIGILGEVDKKQLKSGYYYGGSTDDNARRYLYKSSYTGLNKTGHGFIMDSLIKINDEPFIYGTFLTSTPLPDNVVRENPPVLHLAHPDAYIMIHQTSLATDAKMLISIVQPNGKIIRTIKTPLQGISSYHLYNTHLALAGTQKSGKISDLLYLDLTNGTVKEFTF
ncbi:PA2928 family protein [Flavobacterium sp. FlaQc-48]|uniref:PA2928 family protein n=1 Tax=Flavobacterium sp. FlaQc-48 TaxID=3374181 RepID=UPI003756F91A